MTQQASRVQTVWFSELERWDVNSFQQLNWKWPPEALALLGSALERRVEEADKSASDSLQLLTLRFDGTMEPRKTLAEDTKGALYVAEPGDVVFSRIDVRNGAIGIVPQMGARAVFSNEFPIFRVRSEVALPDYVRLVFRTTHFRAIINGLISGASGRKRVQPAQLESLQVPLPPLDVQRAIVEKWRDGQRAASQARERIAAHQAESMSEFRQQLGTSVSMTRTPRVFTMEWKDLEKWGVEAAWRHANYSHASSYATKFVRELCSIGSGGTPSRTRPEYYGGGIPWVKTTEVRDNRITHTSETLTPQGMAASNAKLYPAGSLLVAMYGQGATRGRTAKLEVDATTNQACAVLYDFAPNIEPDFLWFYLQSEYFNLRALASGNNQPNLNAEMIASYPVPLPPLEIQRDLVARVEARRAEIARERHVMDEEVSRLKRGLEAVILGAMPVESLG